MSSIDGIKLISQGLCLYMILFMIHVSHAMRKFVFSSLGSGCSKHHYPKKIIKRSTHKENANYMYISKFTDILLEKCEELLLARASHFVLKKRRKYQLVFVKHVHVLTLKS